MDRLSDYDYDLPEELVASRPLDRRDASRMLVVNRQSGRIEHRMFADFPTLVPSDDLVVLNNSRVIRARMFSDDDRIELLFVEEIAPRCWKCLVKPGRRMRVGSACRAGGVNLRVIGIEPGGERIVETDGPIDFEAWGKLPIPPYMHRPADSGDDSRYQTVYAGPEGSVAAPTAGLHFTPELLSRIPHTFLTLHVGLGTFQPVKVQNLAEHRMHEERYEISESTAAEINSASRITAVGTTTLRVLESQPEGLVHSHIGRTSIFIRPPYEFRRVDTLLTNFHLPKSTLLMLVSAFGGIDLIRAAYHEAIRKRYRFFSYGDCMLIT